MLDRPTQDPGGPTLRTVRSTQEEGARCRCGTRFPIGASYLTVEKLPGSLLPIMGGLRFCSTRCLRAHFLETLEIVDAMDRVDSGKIVSDLRGLYHSLLRAYDHLVEP